MNKLVETIGHQALKYGSREAFRFCWRKDGEWLATSWDEFATQTKTVARALAMLGVEEMDKIAICSPNTPQILITEIGAFRNRLAVIPLYAGGSQEQFDFIVANGEARILFVGDKHQYPLAYSYWKRYPDRVDRIIVFKNSGFDFKADDTISIAWDDFVRLGIDAPEEIRQLVAKRTADGQPSDMATLIYTSGTTGEPKGVIITHANYDAVMDVHLKALDVSDEDLSMSFLPMSHILEKAWCFFCLTKGIRIAFNYDPRRIQDTIHEVHPNIMCCVPRFWEKVYTAVRDKIAGMGLMQRMAVKRALKVGWHRNIDYVRLGRKVPRLLEREYSFWDRTVFSKLKQAIGIPNPKMFPTAGAPLSDRICEFMRSVGINVKIGYGLSETSATVSCFPDEGYEIGTVGRPLPGIDVKISDDGEILVKASTVTPGYYRNQEANAKAFTADGYFRTGDVGRITDSGHIVLTERVKDLFKTSNGKYIAPQAIESRVAENKYVDEVAVIGDSRKFVTALIVPNLTELCRWAEKEGIAGCDTESLLANPKTISFMMEQIRETQRDMAEYEKIKRVTLLPSHFSAINGEVTNTMKVRRSVVAMRYAKHIEAMYADC